MMRVVWAAIALWIGLGSALALPPPERLERLRRGIDITGWFRHAGSRDPAALRGWMGDAAIADLARAGFGFVRLAVDPALTEDPAVRGVLIEAIRRIHAQGLAVAVGPHPVGWRLETDAADRTRLLTFWRVLAPLLRWLDQGRLFPEVLNEPVFPNDAVGWADLQRRALAVMRAALPDATIVLTGQDWGSVRGLAALTPEPDPNVVYSVHFYDPSELTSLAAWRPGLDRAALSRLPFPWREETCTPTTDHAATADLIRFVCALRWDEARVRAALAPAADWGRRNGAFVLLGEFGASAALNGPARRAWLASVRVAAEEGGMGWALWGYDDIMGFALRRPPPPRPVLDRDILVALGLIPRAE